MLDYGIKSTQYIQNDISALLNNSKHDNSHQKDSNDNKNNERHVKYDEKEILKIYHNEIIEEDRAWTVLSHQNISEGSENKSEGSDNEMFIVLCYRSLFIYLLERWYTFIYIYVCVLYCSLTLSLYVLF